MKVLLYTSQSFFFQFDDEKYELIAGNFRPDTPTMLNLPTLPRRRKSNMVSPTTPTFLSDPEAPPPTKPVVYSPVPTCCPVSLIRFCHKRRLTMRTLGGAILVLQTFAKFSIERNDIPELQKENKVEKRDQSINVRMTRPIL